MNWSTLSIDEVFQKLDTDENGLSSEDARARLDEYGKNEIVSQREVSPLRIFVSQFRSFLVYLLFGAAFLSLGIGLLPDHQPEYIDAGLIFLILIANAVFGFVQDYRAEKSIQALRSLSTPEAKVLRDGKKKVIDSEEVVPGDVIFIEEGDAIPGDARLIESNSLETNESSLTGESTNVSKDTGVSEGETPLAERSNIVYRGTTAVKGRGRAVVVETGMETEVGDIATQISEVEKEKTPFQTEVDRLGKEIGMGVVILVVFVGVVQYFFTSANPISVLLVAITLAVAAVPEGLPAVVTLTLALGSRKMLKKEALVRRLPVIENLGSIDVIVTDKTGTLTENQMTVRELYVGDKMYKVTGTGIQDEGKFTEIESNSPRNESDVEEGTESLNQEREINPLETDGLERLLMCGATCNNADLMDDREESTESDEKSKYLGDPTEVALLVSARKAGIEKKEEKERLKEIPFSSDRKRMTVVVEENAGSSTPTAYMKGAPETVLEHCDRYKKGGGEVDTLSEEKRKEILERNREMASKGMRVLGFAYRELEGEESDKETESHMIFIGLQGMIDPPRNEVPGAVADCRKAGIKAIMATGDNLDTAKAIGEQIGFNTEGAKTGPELDSISDDEIESRVEKTEIFARVSPEHKTRILKALKRNGHRVAMTGDGVNDAPALKNADVGVSMGERGTDVAKQASDMVLLDDNFATIRDAVAEGRGIFDNIRKFVNYLLSANAGEVLVVFAGVLLGSLLFPDFFGGSADSVDVTQEALVLTPVMILWINLVTDGLPALALGADPKSDGIMERKPRPTDEPVINKRIMASIIGIGFIITLTGLAVFFYGLAETKDLIIAQTLLFTFLVAVEMIRIQTIRSRYNQSIFSNKWLLLAIITSLTIHMIVLYTPVNALFGVKPLGIENWIWVFVSFFAFFLLNLGMLKFYNRIVKTSSSLRPVLFLRIFL